MCAVVIDSRSLKFLPEAVEACRLSKIPTVLLTPCKLKMETKYAGALWASSNGEMRLKVVRCEADADSVMDGIRTHAVLGDTVITEDIGVAAFAIERGLDALDQRGKRFDPETIDDDLERRDHEKYLRSMGVFQKPLNQQAPGREDAIRLASAIRGISGCAPVCERMELNYRRILVDADNLPTQRILPVARSLDVPTLIFHDNTMKMGTRLLHTDPIDTPQDGLGFWVQEISVPSGKDAVDKEIVARSQPDDLVLTNDGPLAYACLERGCGVMNRYGVFHTPGELAYFRNGRDFKYSRHIRSGVIKAGNDSEGVAVEFMNRLASVLKG